MKNVLENLYVDSFIRLVCVYLVEQARITTTTDAVTAAYFFADGIYTISPTEMCAYLHMQYGESKQHVLARILQEAIAQSEGVQQVGIGETIIEHEDTHGMPTIQKVLEE